MCCGRASATRRLQELHGWQVLMGSAAELSWRGGESRDVDVEASLT